MDIAAFLSCQSCATPLTHGVRFCTACGARVPEVDAETPSAPMPSDSARYAPASAVDCPGCGGDGQLLPDDKVYCECCRWLRPLAPDYVMDSGAFLWQLDAQAMTVLQSAGPFTEGARLLSGKVGRPWFEATVNGVRLSTRQFPDIFLLAMQAARVMGLRQMPEIYVSGELGWDAMTLGTDEHAFIAIGSVLTYFKGDELLYLLGREMGHIRAGHVLWRTASMFLTGSTHMKRSIMGSGLLSALNPKKFIENAIDSQVMAWSRHSEITADRAGMLVMGKVDVARKVTLSCSLKSFPLYPRIDQEEWLDQEEHSDEQIARVAEMTLSTMPYLARRMKLLREFGASEHLRAWRDYIESSFPGPSEPAPPSPPASAPSSTGNSSVVAGHAASSGASSPDDDVWRFICKVCKTPIRVSREATAGKPVVRVICPSPSCGAQLNIRPPRPAPKLVRFACIQCQTPMAIPRDAMAGQESVKVRCPKPGCHCVMDVAARSTS